MLAIFNNFKFNLMSQIRKENYSFGFIDTVIKKVLLFLGKLCMAMNNMWITNDLVNFDSCVLLQFCYVRKLINIFQQCEIHFTVSNKESKLWLWLNRQKQLLTVLLSIERFHFYEDERVGMMSELQSPLAIEEL